MHPVDGQDDLGCIVVEVGDGLMDDGAHDALLETRVARRRRPDGLQILRQLGEKRSASSPDPAHRHEDSPRSTISTCSAAYDYAGTLGATSAVSHLHGGQITCIECPCRSSSAASCRPAVSLPPRPTANGLGPVIGPRHDDANDQAGGRHGLSVSDTRRAAKPRKARAAVMKDALGWDGGSAAPIQLRQGAQLNGSARPVGAVILPILTTRTRRPSAGGVGRSGLGIRI